MLSKVFTWTHSLKIKSGYLNELLNIIKKLTKVLTDTGLLNKEKVNNGELIF